MTLMDQNRRRGRFVAAVLAAAVTVAVLAGCSRGEPPRSVGTTSTPVSKLVALDPDAFAAAVAAPDAVVVNVHVPYDGEIEGTDAIIPFDQIIGHADLPEDRSARLVLYCRSGNMSEQAGDALISAGYRNVSHLAGGMNAWQSGGRALMTTAGR
jgi:phage shock protein E